MGRYTKAFFSQNSFVLYRPKPENLNWDGIKTSFRVGNGQKNTVPNSKNAIGTVSEPVFELELDKKIPSQIQKSRLGRYWNRFSSWEWTKNYRPKLKKRIWDGMLNFYTKLLQIPGTDVLLLLCRELVD